jgi:hypothetical protein
LYTQQPGLWGQRLLFNLNNLWPDAGLLVAAAIAGGILAIRRRRPRAWLLVVFLALSCVSAFHSPFLYKHYFALLAPALALAGGAGLALLQEACGRGGPAFGMLAATLVLALPVVARPWYWLRPDPIMVSNALLGPQGFEAAPLLAAYVRERTTADERIFVYGSEPQVALEARRRDVNPFVTAYPITLDWPRHREFQRRVWSEIERWRPTYILIPQNPYTRVRSPRADPFFEQHLIELGRRAYRLEALVVRGADGRPRLSTDPAAAPEDPGSVLFEVWRRTG